MLWVIRETQGARARLTLLAGVERSMPRKRTSGYRRRVLLPIVSTRYFLASAHRREWPWSVIRSIKSQRPRELNVAAEGIGEPHLSRALAVRLEQARACH